MLEAAEDEGGGGEKLTFPNTLIANVLSISYL